MGGELSETVWGGLFMGTALDKRGEHTVCACVCVYVCVCERASGANTAGSGVEVTHTHIHTHSKTGVEGAEGSTGGA